MIGRGRVLGLLFGALIGVGCSGNSPVLPGDAPQGVEGRVWLGPQCPVQPSDGSCPDAPYSAVLDLQTAGGAHVTRLRSDTEGRFRAGLRPGRYRMVPRNGDPFPHASPVDFTVEAGRWLQIEILFDTGIR
ncbi:MAG: hypothetical protein KJO11_03015 [Gemmatimonadetes bacterium]|nr:hypothetical protein [Gemmatimonadota bacterium]